MCGPPSCPPHVRPNETGKSVSVKGRAGQERALLLPSQTMQRVGGGKAERSREQRGLLGPRGMGRGPWGCTWTPVVRLPVHEFSIAVDRPPELSGLKSRPHTGSSVCRMPATLASVRRSQCSWRVGLGEDPLPS